MIHNYLTIEMEFQPKLFLNAICCLDARMEEAASLKTNEKLMGHYKNSKNSSCDILWTQKILYAGTCLCFVVQRLYCRRKKTFSSISYTETRLCIDIYLTSYSIASPI